MKIVIAASHRFHLLDLARELAALGHEVSFYSYVPRKRSSKFGLLDENCYSLFPLLLPLLAISKVMRNPLWMTALIHMALDFYVGRFMPRCDVFIGLGTVYKSAFGLAKRRFGATTIVEWGSKHIIDQQEILSKINGKPTKHQYFIARSVAAYNAADFIALPADHAVKTFTARGIPLEKILVNPYGVDVRMFAPTQLHPTERYDVITVGAWSLQKGSDLLVELCRREKISLLHVGPLVDVEFPQMPNMTHVDAVDQSELVHYYAKARVFVHPSRQDGLAMVQCQAVACGLPIVCSENSGGRDLRSFLQNPKWIIEAMPLTVDLFLLNIHRGLELASSQSEKLPRNYAENAMEQLTWRAYGRRYQNNFGKIMQRASTTRCS